MIAPLHRPAHATEHRLLSDGLLPQMPPSAGAPEDDADTFALIAAVTGLAGMAYLAYTLLGPVLG